MTKAAYEPKRPMVWVQNGPPLISKMAHGSIKNGPQLHPKWPTVDVQNGPQNFYFLELYSPPEVKWKNVLLISFIMITT